MDNYVDNTQRLYPARLPDQTRRYRAKRSPPGFLLAYVLVIRKNTRMKKS